MAQLEQGEALRAARTIGLCIGRIARLGGEQAHNRDSNPAFKAVEQAYDLLGAQLGMELRGERYWLLDGWLEAFRESPMWRPQQ